VVLPFPFVMEHEIVIVNKFEPTDDMVAQKIGDMELALKLVSEKSPRLKIMWIKAAVLGDPQFVVTRCDQYGLWRWKGCSMVQLAADALSPSVLDAAIAKGYDPHMERVVVGVEYFVHIEYMKQGRFPKVLGVTTQMKCPEGVDLVNGCRTTLLELFRQACKKTNRIADSVCWMKVVEDEATDIRMIWQTV